MDPSIIVEAVGESVAGAKRELEKLMERKCNELRQSLSLNNQQSSAEVDALAASSDAKIAAVKEDCLRSLDAKLAPINAQLVPMNARFETMQASINMQKQELQALIAKWKGVPATAEKGTGEEDVEKGSGVEEMDASRPLVPATSASLDGLSTPASPAAKAPSVPASAEASLNVSKDAEDMLGTEPLFTQAELSAQMASKIRAIETAMKEADRKRASTKSGEEEGKDESPTSPKRRSLPKSTSPHPSDTAQEHVVDPILPSYSRNNSDPLGLKKIVATEMTDAATDLAKSTIEESATRDGVGSGPGEESQVSPGQSGPVSMDPNPPMAASHTTALSGVLAQKQSDGGGESGAGAGMQRTGTPESTPEEVLADQPPGEPTAPSKNSYASVAGGGGKVKELYLEKATRASRARLVYLSRNTKPVPMSTIDEMLQTKVSAKAAQVALGTMKNKFPIQRFNRINGSLRVFKEPNEELNFGIFKYRNAFIRGACVHCSSGYHKGELCPNTLRALVTAQLSAMVTKGAIRETRDFATKLPTESEYGLLSVAKAPISQIIATLKSCPYVLGEERSGKAQERLQQIVDLMGDVKLEIGSDQVMDECLASLCFLCGAEHHNPIYKCPYSSSYSEIAIFLTNFPKI